MTKFLTAILLFLCLALAQADNIRVVDWNLEWFPGRKPNATPEQQASHMKAAQEALVKLKPDILILEEVRDWAAVEELVSVVPGLKVNVVSHFNRPQNQGIASRFMADSAWSEDWKRNGPDAPPRGYVFAALQLPDGRLLLTYALHLKSNFDGIAPNIPKREESARQLLAHVGDMVKLYGKRGPVAVIIGGDFNTSPDPEFQGEKTFEIIKGAGMDWTFEGMPLQERISHPGSGKYADADFDHIFTAGIGKKRASVAVITGVSDHNPVVLDFSTEDVSPVKINIPPPPPATDPAQNEKDTKPTTTAPSAGEPTFKPPTMEGDSETHGLKAKPKKTTENKKVNLNTATKEELESIPGVGPKLAEQIISIRPFSSLDELPQVKGIKNKKWEAILPFVTLE